MASIVIDGKNYDLDSLSDEIKKNITILHFIDAEIVRLQQSILVQQTARTVYADILKKELSLHTTK